MSFQSAVYAGVGGVLIGLAAALVLIAHGRIAGISGIFGHALDRDGGADFRVPFLVGLVGTGLVLAQLRPSSIGAPVGGVVPLGIAGLAVGIGTTLSHGCTSGHGVCGIGRFRLPSLVAVCTFMLTGGITVAVVEALS